MEPNTTSTNPPTEQHTAAPWVWWTSNSWKRLKRDTHGITENVLEPYVCRDGHADLSVSRADMLLIAAAPELLEALKNMVGFCATTCPEAEMAMDDARKAIAIATGEHS